MSDRTSPWLFSVCFLVLASSGCGGEKPTIEEVTPSTITIRSEARSNPSAADTMQITIRGSGFDRERNDVGFVSSDIEFNGAHTGFASGVASEDGSTLVVDVPQVLGACAMSQLEDDETCLLIGLFFPSGPCSVFVATADGDSNRVDFVVQVADP